MRTEKETRSVFIKSNDFLVKSQERERQKRTRAAEESESGKESDAISYYNGE